MKTQLVFKLEKEPAGYGSKFAPNCQFDFINRDGPLTLDYDSRYLMGVFKELRQDGELFLADIELLKHHEIISHRFEYAVEGNIVKKNENGEITQVALTGVSVLMPPKD